MTDRRESSKLIADITMSLDGFITGPNAGVEHPLGEGGDRLHAWVYDLATFREKHGQSGGESNADSEVLGEAFESVGATIMGKRMFDVGVEPWGDDPPFHMPVYVLTHETREPLPREGGTTFNFVGDLETSVDQARSAAGGKNVSVAGGANVVQQFIKAGSLDEIQIHIAPVLIGDGIRLFEDTGAEHIEFKTTRVIDSPEVTHIRLQLAK